MANSVFARNQLLKHGWTEGAGLGRDETGIKEAIKVKIKNDTTGVGHDPGKEFTCHWWDHVFNKAASSIAVESTEDGVKLKKSSKDMKKNDKVVSNKSMMYAGFVKGAVLQATEQDVMTEVSCHDESLEDGGSAEEEKEAISKLTEDELFSQCEGRTAHKGARHGLKQNAKLLRIQRQEQLLLERLKKSANQSEKNSTNDSKYNKSKQEVLLTETCNNGMVKSDETYNELNSGNYEKKKKKKSKRKVEEQNGVSENEERNDKTDPLKEKNDTIPRDSEEIPRKKHKKAKKKKKRKSAITECLSDTETINLEVKKGR